MLGGRYFQLSTMEKNRQRLQRQRPVPETMRSPDRAEPLALADLAAGVRFQLRTRPSRARGRGARQAPPRISRWSGSAVRRSRARFQQAAPCRRVRFIWGNCRSFSPLPETWAESMSSQAGDQRPSGGAGARAGEAAQVLSARGVVHRCGRVRTGGTVIHGRSALQVMISVFVVSCPCALGVSLPMADEIAGSMMEKVGVFIRQPLLWARLRRVKTVIFDKTGTLTLERPVLANPEAVRRSRSRRPVGARAVDQRFAASGFALAARGAGQGRAALAARAIHRLRSRIFPARAGAIRKTASSGRLASRDGSRGAKSPTTMPNSAATANGSAISFSASRCGRMPSPRWAILKQRELPVSSFCPGIARKSCRRLPACWGFPADGLLTPRCCRSRRRKSSASSTITTRSISATGRMTRSPSTPRGPPARRSWIAACWKRRRISFSWARACGFCRVC